MALENLLEGNGGKAAGFQKPERPRQRTAVGLHFTDGDAAGGVEVKRGDVLDRPACGTEKGVDRGTGVLFGSVQNRKAG